MTSSARLRKHACCRSRSRTVFAAFPLVAASGLVAYILTTSLAVASPQPIHSQAMLFERDDNIWVLRSSHASLLIRDGQCPAWSPDHQQIAFVRGHDIWIARSDGRSPHRLTHFTRIPTNRDSPRQITWYPSGEILAFDKVDHYAVARIGEPPINYSLEEEAKKDLRISNIYAYLLRKANRGSLPPPESPLPPLFEWLDNGDGGLPNMSVVSTSSPAFSPDGRQIAFARNGDLWIASLRNLSQDPHRWEWSESRLVATAYLEGGNHGSNDSAGITRISWSPNSKWIVYSRKRLFGSGGIRDIYVVRAADDFKSRFIDIGEDPCFDPSGSWLAYEDIHGSIMAVTLDGKKLHTLVDNAYYPVW